LLGYKSWLTHLTLGAMAIFVPMVSECLQPVAYAQEDFESQLRRYNEDAKKLLELAVEDGDQSAYERIAETQQKRNQLVRSEWEKNRASPNVWIRAEEVLFEVMGSIGADEFESRKPGLIDRCEYRKAFTLLEDLWNEIRQEENEFLPGHVVTKMFEIVQQQKKMVGGATDETSPNFLLSEKQLKGFLQEAAERDPCCILATPMSWMLTAGSPEEVFLRVEVRPEFKKRQSSLADLSHPSSYVNGSTQDGGKTVAEWNAPAELCKAESLEQVLADLKLGKPIGAKFELTGSGTRLPVAPEFWRDSMSRKVALLYGRAILHRVRDQEGRLRNAVSSIQDGQWQTRYLEILWRKPIADSRRIELPKYQLDLNTYLSAQVEEASFRLDGEDYGVLTFEIEDLSRILKIDPPKLLVKDVFELIEAAGREGNAMVNPNFFKYLRTSKSVAQKSAVIDTKILDEEISSVERKRDRTVHPLDLVTKKMNPILIISEFDGDGDQKNGVSPAWIHDDGEAYFVRDGANGSEKLFFRKSEDGRSLSFQLESGVVTAFMPLTFDSVDSSVLRATPLGQVMSELLNEAGYSSDEASEELQKVVESLAKGGRPYWPSKYKRLAALKGKALNDAGLTGHEQLCREAMKKLFGWTESSEPVYYGLGFVGAPPEQKISCLSDLLNPVEMWQTYGMRSLRGPNNMLITSRGLTGQQFEPANADGDGQPKKEQLSSEDEVARDENNAKEYPYDVWEPDGSSRVPIEQIYSWQEYNELQDNIFYEHLTKMLMLHPAPAGLKIIEDFARSELENPFAGTVDYNKEEKSGDEKKSTGEKKPEREASYVELSQYYSLRVFGEDLSPQQTAFVEAMNLVACRYAEIFKLLSTVRHELARLEAAYSSSMQDANYAQMAADNAGRLDKVGSTWNELRIAYTKDAEGARAAATAAAKKRNELLEEKKEKERQLAAILHRSARSFADEKFYHTSIVFYNDALDLTSKTQAQEKVFDFFLNVASSKKAEKFIDDVANLISRAKYRLQLQIEMAKVLQQTGFRESSTYLISRVVDSHRWFLSPAIRLSEEFVEAYGLTFSKRMNKAIEGLETLVRTAKRLQLKANLAVNYRAVPAESDPDFSALLARANEARENDSDNFSNELGVGLALRIAGRRISYEEWLEAKFALISDEELFFRGEFLISPEKFCPAEYTDKRGFVQDGRALFSRVGKETLRAFVKGIEPKEFEARVACRFALAWYWLETSQPDVSRARAAFMAAAQCCDDEALKTLEEAGSPNGYVAQYNKFIMLLGASSCLSRLPGLTSVSATTEFSEGLLAQAYSWQKEWFSVGLSASHAAVGKARVESLLGQIAEVKVKLAGDTKLDTYYFPNYTFWKSGCLPDPLLIELLDFQEDKKEKKLKELEEKVEEPAEGGDGQDVGPEASEAEIYKLDSADVEAFFGTLEIPSDLEWITQ
jgi:hypothetical protein